MKEPKKCPKCGARVRTLLANRPPNASINRYSRYMQYECARGHDYEYSNCSWKSKPFLCPKQKLQKSHLDGVEIFDARNHPISFGGFSKSDIAAIKAQVARYTALKTYGKCKAVITEMVPKTRIIS